MHRLNLFLLTLALGFSPLAISAPFESCPSSAYLMQGASATLYGVNLATGSYSILSDDLGTTSKMNAVGFSSHDQYIYGYGYEAGTVVRIHSDFSFESLSTSNAPRTSFYVGDVSLEENAYFAYKPGSDFGLYRLDLDAQSNSYLEFSRVIDGGQLNLAIYDFAFHPTNGLLYAVDRTGRLISISPFTGEYEVISNVGEAGTFGAVYFDSEEYLYISRNTDGHIFRINLKVDSPSAEFFAFGPSSSNNDGARCATADIIDDSSNIDFGSAPESYGSTIADNGARHERVDGIQLGEGWGTGNDGVEFVTNIEAGVSTVLVSDAKSAGYINAWGDWDQNGSFEDDEQVIVDQRVEPGQNLSLIDIPDTAKAGETWSRVRFSTQKGVGVNGGVSDGEVEDYAVEVLGRGTSITHYPSKSSFVTFAFEDNWPQTGDYDMNDVVVAMRSSKYDNADNQTIRYQVFGKVLALGAGYHNGFAIQLDGVPTSAVDTNTTSLFINGIKTDVSPLEANSESEDAVLIISNDLTSYLSTANACDYYRTQVNCDAYESLNEFRFNLVVALSQAVPANQSPSNELNPFIFATPGIYHGDDFAVPPGRSLEIHLKNKPVSARFDQSFFGLADDSSDSSNTFITANGMPWALEVPGLWSHPLEKRDLLAAYPNFREFVESNAELSKTWYADQFRINDLVIENLPEHINE